MLQFMNEIIICSNQGKCGFVIENGTFSLSKLVFFIQSYLHFVTTPILIIFLARVCSCSVKYVKMAKYVPIPIVIHGIQERVDYIGHRGKVPQQLLKVMIQDIKQSAVEVIRR